MYETAYKEGKKYISLILKIQIIKQIPLQII